MAVGRHRAAMMAVNLARKGFDIDLRHGEAREDALVHALLNARVEAKSDGKCRMTGNLFVEFSHRGQPSGIATTTAERWAFEFDDDCWLMVPTDRVREAARRAVREDRRVLGGDFNLSEGALVPIRWLVGRTDLSTDQFVSAMHPAATAGQRRAA